MMMGRLKDQTELENTRAKLRILEEEYAAAKERNRDNEYVRGATLRSLKRLINQLTEEIAWFEAHAKGAVET